MKAPRTKGIVKVTIEGKKRSLYLVPKDKAEDIERLLDEYRADDFVPAEEVLKGLHDKYGVAGSRLRGYRVRDGLSQGQLAAKLKCPQSWIAGWECGTRSLGKKWAAKLATHFKTDPRVFL
jgi:DNA-binding transcriptional regulator YiaG